MKKTYINPKIRIVELRARHLLSGSGPNGGSQSNPGMSPSMGSAPRFKVFYDEEDEDF